MTAWSERAEEILADGEWHSGRELMREALKVIPPGIAVRITEVRRRSAQRRHAGEPGERVRELNMETLVAMGKVAIFQGMAHNRVRDHSWEVQPWPLPDMGWSTGQFEIRSVKVRRYSLTAAASKLKTSKKTLNGLVAAGLLPDHIQVGRVIYLLDLDAAARALEAYRADEGMRRSAGNRKGREGARAKPPTKVTVTALARQSLIAVRTAGILADQAPHLPWEQRGRVRYLPVEAIPQWEQAVDVWRSQQFLRRSMAAKATRARHVR